MKDREHYWDAVKALLIILVFLGHAIQIIMGGDYWNHPVFKGIYMFHMPLFIMVSGYFGITGIEKRGWPNVLHQAMRLLPPVAFFFIMEVATYVCISGLPFTNAVAHADGGLWFLVVLMECIVFGHVMLCFRNKLWRGAWMILPIWIGIIAEGIMPYASYFTTMWPCFLIGAYLRKRNFQASCINAKWLLSVPLFAVAYLCFKNEWHMYLTPLDLNAESVFAWLARLACAIAESACFLFLVRICRAEKCRFLYELGTATLALYVLQSLCLKAMIMLFPFHCDNTITVLALSIATNCALYLVYLSTRKSRAIAILLYGEYA